MCVYIYDMIYLSIYLSPDLSVYVYYLPVAEEDEGVQPGGGAPRVLRHRVPVVEVVRQLAHRAQVEQVLVDGLPAGDGREQTVDNLSKRELWRFMYS